MGQLVTLGGQDVIVETMVVYTVDVVESGVESGVERGLVGGIEAGEVVEVAGQTVVYNGIVTVVV